MNVYILLGGLFGPDGYVTSAGMFSLASQLRKLPGVSVSTYTWNNWEKVPAFNGNKVALIGYSGGGSRATWLANTRTMAPIDLLVAYDPSPKWQMEPLRSNVRRAICYYNQNPCMPSPYGMLGGGKLTGNCKILTRNISIQHLFVQFDKSLHAATIEAVKELM